MSQWKQALTPSVLRELFDWGWFDESGLMSKQPRDGAVFDLLRTDDERWSSQQRGFRVSEANRALNRGGYPFASFPTSVYCGCIESHKLIPAMFLGAHAEQGIHLDHIDRDKLNYDPRNLSMCTAAQNNANKHANPSPDNGGWRIKVRRGRKSVFSRWAHARKHGSDEAAQAWLIAEYEEWLADNSPTLPTIWDQYLELTSGIPYEPPPLQRYVRPEVQSSQLSLF